MEQIVDFRWGDRYFVNEFIQPKSYLIQQVAQSLSDIPAFIRDGFQYPLDNSGNPSTDGQLSRYHRGLLPPGYQFKAYKYYIWAFPAEVLISKLGYCAETANLSTSLFRTKDANAYTGIGEVRQTDNDELLGYHAWTIIDDTLQETTIHTKGLNTVIPLKDAYSLSSSFAKEGNVLYIEHARYNEKEYIGKTSLGQSGIIFQLLGKPQKFLNLYGLECLLKMKPHTLHKQWQKEERVKCNIIERAFGGGND